MKRPTYIKVKREGAQIAVVRPQDPALALRLAREAKNDDDFQKVLQAQRYFFVGLLANRVVGSRAKIVTTPVILCPITSKPVGDVLPGDSFVSYPELLESTPGLLEQLKQRLH